MYTREIHYYKEEYIDNTSTTDKSLVPDIQWIIFHMEASVYEISTALQPRVSDI